MKNRSLLLFLVLGVAACTPKVYVIDRQTVLEEEAAGEWPEFSAKSQVKNAEKAPVPLGQVKNSERRQQLYRVLNGNLVSEVTK